MPYYEMRFAVGEMIGDIIFAAIGRRPSIIGVGAGGKIIQIEFDVDLTPAERTTVLNAMPDWIRKMYKFTRFTGTLKPLATP